MKKWMLGLVVALVAMAGFAYSGPSMPWDGYMVFDGTVALTYASTEDDGTGYIGKETIKGVLVVYGESATLIDVEKGEYYLVDNYTEISAGYQEVGDAIVKKDKNGNDIGYKAVIAAYLNAGYGYSELLGTGTWTGKYNKEDELTSQSSSLVLNGAVLTDGAAYGSSSLRYNQAVSNAMNDEENDAPEELATYIAKLAKIRNLGEVAGMLADLEENANVFNTIE